MLSGEVIFALIVIYILGNLAGRLDSSHQHIHKGCDYAYDVLIHALMGACYNIDKDKTADVFNQYIVAAKDYIAKKEKPNGKL